jgi:hypothetical protein
MSLSSICHRGSFPVPPNWGGLRNAGKATIELAEAELYEANYYLKIEKIEQLRNETGYQYIEILCEEAEIIRKRYQEMPMRIWRG